MSHYVEPLRAGYLGNLPTIRTLQLLARLSADDAARFCRVSPETFRPLAHRPPAAAQRLLAIRAGCLPWPGWEDWLCLDGRLVPPRSSADGLAPGEILAIPFYHQLLAARARELKALRRATDVDRSPSRRTGSGAA